MKLFPSLRIATITLAACATAAWYLLGANLGWTKTRVPVSRLDEITGIRFDDWEHRFIPGVELLALVLGLCACTFLTLHFLAKKKQNTPTNQ